MFSYLTVFSCVTSWDPQSWRPPSHAIPLVNVTPPVRHAKQEGPFILIVEDNPADAFIMEEALREIELHYSVTVISNGEEALGFFDHLGTDVSAPCPNLVLLDLNLPSIQATTYWRTFVQTSAALRFR